jgi:hypothetical protein
VLRWRSGKSDPLEPPRSTWYGRDRPWVANYLRAHVHAQPSSWLVPTLAVSRGGAAYLTAQDAGAHGWRTDRTAGTHALTRFGTPFPVRNLTGNGTHP